MSLHEAISFRHCFFDYAEQEQEPPEPQPLPHEELEAKNGLLTGTFTASDTVLPISKLISSSKS